VLHHRGLRDQPLDDGTAGSRSYALSGSATAFLGHGMVTLFTTVFASQSIGLGSAVILLGAGLALMHRVVEKRAPEIA
jgi:MFS-type transporter involved in bile tolerance (Atg22 family)